MERITMPDFYDWRLRHYIFFFCLACIILPFFLYMANDWTRFIIFMTGFFGAPCAGALIIAQALQRRAPVRNLGAARRAFNRHLKRFEHKLAYHPEKITTRDRFLALAYYYGFCRAAALHNLRKVKRKKQASSLTPFMVNPVKPFLSYDKENKVFGIYLGELNGTTFTPLVTEKIIFLFSSLELLNAVIRDGEFPPQGSPVKSLQSLSIDSLYLERAFLYCSRKFQMNRTMLRKGKATPGYEIRRRRLFDAHVANFKRQIFSLIPQMIDLRDMNDRLSKIRMIDCSWIDQDITQDHKEANGYLLPPEYYKPLFERSKPLRADTPAEAAVPDSKTVH